MRHDARTSISGIRPIYTRCDYQAHASICERFSIKTGQRDMEFSMKRKRGRREAVNTCDCHATAMRLAPILHHIVARASVARIWYKLPYTPNHTLINSHIYRKATTAESDNSTMVIVTVAIIFVIAAVLTALVIMVMQKKKHELKLKLYAQLEKEKRDRKRKKKQKKKKHKKKKKDKTRTQSSVNDGMGESAQGATGGPGPDSRQAGGKSSRLRIKGIAESDGSNEK
ncbi:hypothetical protein Y032_0387g458 [Ancylostoma ceylanicum]|uniref:Uncharacterized protein n=1 Tax=Ancylostoma ceylanicum TaxID=53326 RepID=A0A016RT40_9BILA|nr:hypothetical protein Y032_0387g458 [Ancylostoma ceylanicum]